MKLTKIVLKNHQEFIKKNKLILKTQQTFKSDRHVFTEDINKIALSSNDNTLKVLKFAGIKFRYFHNFNHFCKIL